MGDTEDGEFQLGVIHLDDIEVNVINKSTIISSYWQLESNQPVEWTESSGQWRHRLCSASNKYQGLPV